MEGAVGSIPQPAFLVLIEVGVGIVAFQPVLQFLEGFQTVVRGVVAEQTPVARYHRLAVYLGDAHIVALGQLLRIIAPLRRHTGEVGAQQEPEEAFLLVGHPDGA